MQKVPSQLLVFPDEGHWVLKPQNSVLWYKTFLDWMDRWARAPNRASTQSGADSACYWNWNKTVKILTIVVVLLIIAVPLSLYFLSSGTGIAVSPEVKAVGESTPVHVTLNNPHGVRNVKAILEQDGKSYPIAGPQEPAHRFRFFKNAKPVSATLNVGRGNAPALHDGKAKLTIEAQSNDMRGQTDSVSFDVDVITKPPHVVADGVWHYVNQAGCGLVAFTPSGYVSDSGVMVKDYVFRSFPLPNHPGERFSLFAYPWDLPAGIEPWSSPPIPPA